ncbi:MAG: hypothetical protein HY717_08435 [Planctomycetes bacterium]|nr:hypothetical protein [Planctomycetota bacterium]
MAGTNKLKGILSVGQVTFGFVMHTATPAFVEIGGRAGFDFVLIDTEHGLYDLGSAGDLIRAARGVDLTALVRVLKNEPELIMKALDLGGQGVIVPHVGSRDDALLAVEAAHLGPGGRRGACPLVAAADFGLVNWRQFQRQSNENTLVIPLIEDLEGTERIDEILSVPGIDIIFIGPFDMSVSGGFEGDMKHPEVMKGLDRVLAACQKRGVPVMMSMTGGEDPGPWIQKGVRAIMQRADSAVFASACRQFLNSVSRWKINAVGDKA